MTDCKTDTVRWLIMNHPNITLEELYAMMDIKPTMKGSKSVIRSTVTKEIRMGRIVKNSQEQLSIGDLSQLHNRIGCSAYPNASIQAITEYLKEHPDSTAVEIGDAVQLTAPTVRKNLKRMGAIHSKQGNEYIWRLKE